LISITCLYLIIEGPHYALFEQPAMVVQRFEEHRKVVLPMLKVMLVFFFLAILGTIWDYYAWSIATFVTFAILSIAFVYGRYLSPGRPGQQFVVNEPIQHGNDFDIEVNPADRPILPITIQHIHNENSNFGARFRAIRKNFRSSFRKIFRLNP
jgi:hypothetical protein